MRPIPGGSIACMVMWGNGVATGMVMTTTSSVQRMTHVGRIPGRAV